MHDDDRTGRIGYDPRWEVQPETDDEEDPGSNVRAVLIALLAMTLFVMLIVWLVVNAPPAF
jgi:hypothetical protein